MIWDASLGLCCHVVALPCVLPVQILVSVLVSDVRGVHAVPESWETGRRECLVPQRHSRLFK